VVLDLAPQLGPRGLPDLGDGLPVPAPSGQPLGLGDGGGHHVLGAAVDGGVHEAPAHGLGRGHPVPAHHQVAPGRGVGDLVPQHGGDEVHELDADVDLAHVQEPAGAAHEHGVVRQSQRAPGRRRVPRHRRHRGHAQRQEVGHQREEPAVHGAVEVGRRRARPRLVEPVGEELPLRGEHQRARARGGGHGGAEGREEARVEAVFAGAGDGDEVHAASPLDGAQVLVGRHWWVSWGCSSRDTVFRQVYSVCCLLLSLGSILF